jgi:hypothetical protein
MTLVLLKFLAHPQNRFVDAFACLYVGGEFLPAARAERRWRRNAHNLEKLLIVRHAHPDPEVASVDRLRCTKPCDLRHNLL